MNQVSTEPPSHLRLRDKWMWIRLFGRRHDALVGAMERRDGLKEIQTYLDRIGEMEGVRGQTGTRDALEMWNICIHWIREHRPDWVQARTPEDPFGLSELEEFSDFQMFSSCDEFLPSSPFSRLQHSTIVALGNERLLQAREAEDKVIDRRVAKAIKKFAGTYDGTRGGLDEWMDRYCLADPDGHLWEVAYNPYVTLAEDGSLKLPD